MGVAASLIALTVPKDVEGKRVSKRGALLTSPEAAVLYNEYSGFNEQTPLV